MDRLKASQSAKDKYDPSVDVTNTVLQWLLAISGLILNVWVFIGLRRSRRKRGVYFLIWALSIIDFYFIFVIFLRFTLIGTLIRHDLIKPESEFDKWHEKLDRFMKPQYVAVQLMTIWFVIALNRERFVTVCRPFQSPSQNVYTKGDAKRFSLILVFLSVAVCVPIYFDWFVISEETRSTDGYDISLNFVYTMGLYSLFAHVSPFLAILYLQCRVHSSKRNQEREQQFLEEPILTYGPNYVAGTNVDHMRVSVHLVRSEMTLNAPTYDSEKERSLTQAVSLVTFIFIVSQVPWITIRILHPSIDTMVDTENIPSYLRGSHISALLVNSALKCVIYCMARLTLRKSLCHCAGGEGDEDEEDDDENMEPEAIIPMQYTIPRTSPYGHKLETTF